MAKEDLPYTLNFMSKRVLLSVFGISFVILAIASAFAYRAFYDVTHLLIVHVDAFRGIDFLGTRRDVFGIAATAFAAYLMNALLAGACWKRYPFLVAFIAWSTLAFSILVGITLGLIVANN